MMKRNRPANMGAQVNTPPFMGWQEGLTQAQVQQFIKNQKRIKGFSISVPTGGSTTNLELSGTARLFVGFAIQPLVKATFDDLDDYPNEVQLTINNEIIIDKTHPIFFGPDYMTEEYYQLIRPLSGQDTLTLVFGNTAAATTMGLVVYYI